MADDKKMYFKNKAENIFIDDNTNVKTALEDKASKNHTHRTALSLVPTGTNIPKNADLNTIDYIKVGCYYCESDDTASTLKNCPTDKAFMMEIYSPINKAYDNESTLKWMVRIRKIMTHDGHILIQIVNSGATAGVFTYHPWYKIYSEYDKPSIGNGTIKIKQNGNEKGAFTVNQSGNTIIDLGTVLTGGKQTTTSSEDGGSNVYTFSDNSTITIKNGSKGSAGKDGTSAVWFAGTTVTGTATTATPFTVSGSKAGDMYLNTSTYNVYRASAANSWIYVCNIKGAKGDKGNPGVNGTNGTSAAWFTGTAVTGTATTATSFTVSGSKTGDMYINTSTFNVYKATSANSWVYVCNIKGAKGDKGDPGVNATTTATGTTTTAGLTKLYTSTGNNTDGTITQAALKSALDKKSPTDHTHYYAGSSTVGGSATSTLMIKDNASASSNSKDIIISYDAAALTSADYVAAWNSSGNMLQKISSSNVNAGKVNGHTVNSDVPSGAKFTDHYEKYTVLTSGDFNTYTGKSDGIAEYYTGAFGIAAGNLDAFTNCPEQPSGHPSVLVFTLKVYKGVVPLPTSYDVTWQEYTNIPSGKQYTRYYKNSKWSGWLERDPKDDSGWINISSFGTNVKRFSSTTPCRIRRIGSTVQVNAVFGTSADLGTGIVTLAKLGSVYGPSAELCTVQNGVGTYRWLCTMKTDGSITAQLYSNGSSAVSIPSGAYLHCNFVYNL